MALALLCFHRLRGEALGWEKLAHVSDVNEGEEQDGEKQSESVRRKEKTLSEAGSAGGVAAGRQSKVVHTKPLPWGHTRRDGKLESGGLLR